MIRLKFSNTLISLPHYIANSPFYSVEAIEITTIKNLKASPKYCHQFPTAQLLQSCNSHIRNMWKPDFSISFDPMMLMD